MKRVRMLESIAGLADPAQAQLEQKYEQIARKLEKKPQSQIDGIIALERAKDQAAPRMGFRKDWSFKPGDEPTIPAELAEKWEDAGICTILTKTEKAAA